MAGAWELREANKLLLGILHTEGTTIPWALNFRRLILPGRENNAIFPITGAPFDQARNVACQACLNGPYQWLAFLDSDVAAPQDAFLRLMSHNKPVVSGVYYRRSPPHGLPVAQKMQNGVRTWLRNVPSAGLIDVDVVGAGLMVIHRSVLELVARNPIHPGKKWFFWGVDQQGLVPPEYGQSEDFSFNSHCKKLGIPILVDCSVVAKHIGLAEYGKNSCKPVEMVPV